MNVELYWEGIDITNEVISYRRQESICESSGTIEIEIKGNSTRAFQLYDELVVYEESIKKATYKINSIDKSLPTYKITLQASNPQKDLFDCFIVDTYNTTDYPDTKTRYWIEKFLTEAGVSYSFSTAGLGEYLPELTLGHSTVGDTIRQLLQYSGWYMRYDADGVAIIGNLDYSPVSYVDSLTDSEILDINTILNDSTIRNRAVVWGMGIPNTTRWVHADETLPNPYTRDSNDIRTVLISNHYINNTYVAKQLALKALREFQYPIYEKRIKAAGTYSIKLGDAVRIRSKYFSGICLTTSIEVSMSSTGLITDFIFDQKCPRLVGYLTTGLNEYVYIATEGDGVWRKKISDTHVWEDFSTGITDLNVEKLSIFNGVFACNTRSGKLFTRYLGDDYWVQYSPYSAVAGSGYVSESGTFLANITYTGLMCSSSSIDKDTSKVLGLFYIPESFLTPSGTVYDDLVSADVPVYSSIFPILSEEARTWVAEISDSVGTLYNLHIEGVTSVGGIDIDNDSESNYVVAQKLDWEDLEDDDLDLEGLHSYFIKNTDLFDDFTVEVENGWNVGVWDEEEPLADWNEGWEFYNVLGGGYNDETGGGIKISAKSSIKTDYSLGAFVVSKSSDSTSDAKVLVSELETNRLYAALVQDDFCDNTGSSHYSTGIRFDTRGLSGEYLYPGYPGIGDGTGITYYNEYPSGRIAYIDLDGGTSSHGLDLPRVFFYAPSGYSTYFRHGDFLSYLGDNSGNLDVDFYEATVEDTSYELGLNFSLRASGAENDSITAVFYIKTSDELNTNLYRQDDVLDSILTPFMYITFEDNTVKKAILYPIYNLSGTDENRTNDADSTLRGTLRYYLTAEEENKQITRISVGTYVDGRMCAQYHVEFLLTSLSVPNPSVLLNSTVLLKNSKDSTEVSCYLADDTVCLDISSGLPVPVVTYGGNNKFGANSGRVAVYNQGEANLTNIFVSGYVNDAKSCLVFTESGTGNCSFFAINTLSGYDTSAIILTDYAGIFTEATTFGSFPSYTHAYFTTEYASFSGSVTAIETTNSQEVPYFFAGIQMSNSGYTFYQKDCRAATDPETTFIERNTNLPQSRINCIRVDDIV